MAISPHHHSMPEHPIDFRAPPPSPIASGRRSTVTNDDVLTEFLEHSLRVPNLVLPDKVFPRQKVVETPPRIDFQSLKSQESDSLSKALDSMSRLGCFQLVSHGIPGDLMRLVLAMAAGIFSVAPEKKAAVTRSTERRLGYELEELHGEEESHEMSEEFVWCRDKGLKLDMEGIWPTGYSNFSEKMEMLQLEVENVAEQILRVLWENCPKKSLSLNDMMEGQDIVGSVCYVTNHRRSILSDESRSSSLGYDVIKMLIRGTDYSHALCFHICDGSSEFHVYSKKGWVSFSPDKDALLVTVGDQAQVLSGGHYKHVLGRPIFRGEKEDCISMAFLYSPPRNTTAISAEPNKGKAISLRQQAVIAMILTIIYRLLLYVCKEL